MSSNGDILFFSFKLRFLVAGMSVKDPCGGKFTQLVAHHVFRDKYGQKFLAVVNGECQTHKLGQYGRPTRPGLNDFSAFAAACRFNLFQQVCVYKRSLF